MKAKTCLLLPIACCLAAAAADPPATQPGPSARQILDRMAKTYSHCASYSDSGCATTVFFEGGRKRTVLKPFATAFIRPDRFRFEYYEKVNDDKRGRYIVWARGKDVRTWWEIRPGVEKEKSLGLALAGATGVSGGSAHTIPGLLMPKEVGGRLLTTIEKSKRVEDAKLDNVDCYRIKGRYGGSPMTLWIDKRTHLVRRIDTRTKFDNFRTEETTTYAPSVDEPVPAEKLEFKAPGEKPPQT